MIARPLRPRRRPAGWQQDARQAAREAGFPDVQGFVRQMGQEAHGQDLTSPAGAQGPAQFMPATARSVGLNDRTVHQRRPAYRAAAGLMAGYARKYGVRNAYVAYNAGPGAIGRPLPAETANYLRVIRPGSSRGASSRSRDPGISGSRATQSRGFLSPGSPGSTTVGTFDDAGYQQAQRKQLLAQMLQRSGRGNSVLFRTGLLSTAAVNPTDFQGTARVATLPRPGVGAVSTLAPGAASLGPSSGQVDSAVRAARRRLGIAEVNGSNRGREVDAMEKRFGMVGQPWCGIFVGTALREAGVRGVDSRVASVSEIERMARNHEGAFAGGFHPARKARAGDALITRQGQHVAFVTRVDRDGTIHVIGGNQGSGAVTRSTWRPEQVYGVARPRYR